MSGRNASRLEAGLIARKGQAAPAAPAPPEPESPAPTPRGIQGTIAITVRLDPDRYERLKVHGARRRLTNQTIMIDALDRYFGALKG